MVKQIVSYIIIISWAVLGALLIRNSVRGWMALAILLIWGFWPVKMVVLVTKDRF